MYEQYLADPASVSASWQEFFHDYRRDGAPTKATTPPAATTTTPTATATASAPATAAPTAAAAPATAPPAAPAPTSAAAPTAPAPEEDEGEPLRGAAALIASNMM